MPSEAIIHVRPPGREPDGVADYQVRLFEEQRASPDMGCAPRWATLRDLRAALRGTDKAVVHFQLPMRGWRLSVLIFLVPLALKLFARSAKVVLTLHELRDTKPLRRAVNIAFLLFVDKLLVPSEQILDDLGRFRLRRFAEGRLKAAVIPIGPNIVPPPSILAGGDTVPPALVIGYFGLLYPGKQPLRMLAVFAEVLKARPAARFLVIGDFLSQYRSDKQAFTDTIGSLGLTGSLDWHGYVEEQADVARLLSQCGAFLLFNARGFTDRNGSVMTCMAFGRPVMTSAPKDSAAPLPALFEEARENRVLNFVMEEETPKQVASRILLRLDDPGRSVIRFGIWERIVGEHRDVYRRLLEADR